MSRDRSNKQSLGSLLTKIRNSKVLLVGAGGIGCELLKNLVLTGFGSVDIIDLDTIDLSNLNRQFLFRQEHIKKSKSLVAKEVASKFRRDVEITAHHGNIKDPEFNVDWFAQFDIVFNALDNLDARRHVNRMCLAADVPLIESGTTGFNGQVQVIKKGLTECYDCNTKPVPKSFPVCTIRSTPSQPIHCIVWAKSYLLPELFGQSEDGLIDETENAENAEEIANLKKEAQVLQSIRGSMAAPDFPEKVFNKVFDTDIVRLSQMEDMWKSKRPPKPLSYDELQKEASDINVDICSKDQKTWSLAENLVIFKDSLARLTRRFQEMQPPEGESPIISFDKDDDDTLDFVAASANIRSHIFDIEKKSKFEIKQMAGNIIPAIATTNAMTAALCVLQAFKVLKGDFDKARMVFLERTGVRALNSDTLKPPNPNCPVCSVVSSRLAVDPARATLGDLVNGILRLQLGYGEEFSVNTQAGTVYDPDLEDNLPRKLSDLGISSDSFITVVDEDDESPRINFELIVTGRPSEEDKVIALMNQVDIPRKAKPQPPAPESKPASPSTNGVGTKRKRSADDADGNESNSKRVEMSNGATAADGDDKAHPIELDDDTGPIELD